MRRWEDGKLERCKVGISKLDWLIGDFKMLNALKYKAIYKDGVLIPFEKIDLDEGEKVEIEIKKEENKKNLFLRGLWKGVVIKDEDVDEAKFIWEKGLKKQIKFLEVKYGNKHFN